MNEKNKKNVIRLEPNLNIENFETHKEKTETRLGQWIGEIITGKTTKSSL